MHRSNAATEGARLHVGASAGSHGPTSRPAPLRAVPVTDEPTVGGRGRRSRERRTHAASFLPAVFYKCDPDPLWTCRAVDGREGQLPGIDPRAWTQAPQLWLERVHPGDRERLISDRLRVTEAGETLSCDYRMVTADGTVIWVHDEAALAEDGAIHGLLLDTTRQHQLEDVLRRLHEAASTEIAELRLERRRRDVFFRTYVHDIRAALVGLEGALGDAAPGAATRTAVERVRGLSDAVLELERTSLSDTSREEVDLDRLLVQVVADADPVDHPVSVESSGIRVVTSATLVRSVVANLVANALAHTPAGTPVRVIATLTSDRLVVAVEDDGPGIPDDVAEQVFEPGVRSAASTGTGTGLALVRELAELHGGALRVDALPGRGTAFLLELPR